VAPFRYAFNAIHEFIEVVWPLLPKITILLRFCAALIGLGLSVDAVARRLRERRRTRQQ
jgi:hypothetical protein